MNIILLGAPGAGKGTQGAFIEEKYGLVHVSTGDIFRENIREGTPLGKMAKGYMDEGKLVPDDVTCSLVEERLSREDARRRGYMLDGFPRNLFQAGRLDAFSAVDMCLDIDVPEELLLDRICGRRMCECGASYHVSQLGGSETCPKCGRKLYVRSDDNPDTVAKRLATYREQTAPLEEYYSSRGKLIKVTCGTETPEEVFRKIDVFLSVYAGEARE